MARKALLLLMLLIFSLPIELSAQFSRTEHQMETTDFNVLRSETSLAANAAWIAKDYAVVNTGNDGRAVAVYEDNIAFFTIENGQPTINYYSVVNGKTKTTNASGLYPAIYEDIITFTGFSIRYYNISREETVNTGIPTIEDIPSIYKNIIAFPVYEVHSGDLNDDGDTNDSVVMYYNIEKKELVNTRVVGWGVSVYGDIIAFSTFESQVAQDLNDDGDMSDSIVRYYNITSKAVTNTKANGWWLSMYKNIIAFESVYTTYFGLTYYNIIDGTIVDTKIDGRMASVYENIIAFSSPEGDYGVGDLNGDGDSDDWVVGYYDIAKKIWINTRADGSDPSIHGNLISFETSEESLGQDLNNDGDTTDNVIRYILIQSSPIQATLDIRPRLLNLRSKGRWITGYIKLPGNYTSADIDLSTIKLNNSITADPKQHDMKNHHNRKAAAIIVKFNRAQVINLILKTLGTEHIWTVKLTVTGKLRDGNFFEATAVIRIICNSKHRLFLLRTLNNS